MRMRDAPYGTWPPGRSHATTNVVATQEGKGLAQTSKGIPLAVHAS